MITNREDFEAAVAATKNGKPLIITFTVSENPCYLREKSQFAMDYYNLTVKEIDIKNNIEVAKEAQISCIPTMIVYKEGVEVERLESVTSFSLFSLMYKHRN